MGFMTAYEKSGSDVVVNLAYKVRTQLELMKSIRRAPLNLFQGETDALVIGSSAKLEQLKRVACFIVFSEASSVFVN